MVQTLSCPSCGKPVAKALLQAGYRNCHHCGTKLTPMTPPPPTPRPDPRSDQDPIRRPTSETGIIGSSPQWQEPQPSELRKPGEPLSSDTLRPLVRRRRIEPPTDERPVNLGEHVVPLPGEAAVNPAPAPAAHTPKLPSPKPAGAQSGLRLGPTGSISAGKGAAAVPAISADAERPSQAPSAQTASTVVRSIRVVRRSSAASWMAPLAVVIGFALTLAAVVFFLLKSSR